jgi:hypothetical protein
VSGSLVQSAIIYFVTLASIEPADIVDARTDKSPGGMLLSMTVTCWEPCKKTSGRGGCIGYGNRRVRMASYSSGKGAHGRRIDAVRGDSVLAPLDRLDAVAARARTSISAVAKAGVGVSSGTHRGGVGAMDSRAMVLEVLQKKDGEKAAPKMSRTGMQNMCWITVAKPGAISG